MKNIKTNKKFNNVNKNLLNVLYKTPKKILKENKNRKFSLPGIYYKNFNNVNNGDNNNNNKIKIAIYKKIPEIEKYFNINDKIINNLKSKESMGLFEENFSSFSKNYNHRKNCLSLSINKKKKLKGILNLKNVKQRKKHIQFIDRKNLRLKTSPIRKSQSNIFLDDNKSNILNKSIESPSSSSKKKRIKKSSTLSANFKYKKDYFKIKSIKSISSLSSYVNINNNNNEEENKNTKPFQLYRTSILDKMILKITNPEEIFEDYLLDNRPGDNYIRFKINLKKQKIKIEKLLIELRASQKRSDYEIKKYNPKLKIKNKNFFNSKY